MLYIYIYGYTHQMQWTQKSARRPCVSQFRFVICFSVKGKQQLIYLLGKQVINHASSCVNANLLLKAYTIFKCGTCLPCLFYDAFHKTIKLAQTRDKVDMSRISAKLLMQFCISLHAKQTFWLDVSNKTPALQVIEKLSFL